MKEEEKSYNIYKIETEEKLDKIKVLVIIIAIFILFTLIFIGKNLVEAITYGKIYKQYEQQLIMLKAEEANKNVKEEEERKAEQANKEKIPQLTEIGKENIVHIYSSEKKRAFLTFDDGPSNRTIDILNTLKQENATATFFVLGSRVEYMPDVVKQIYDEGHYIANHGYSHVYTSIYSSPEAVLDEYTRCNDAVKNAIGVQEYNSHLFRFPGGLVGGKYATIKSQAKELLNQNNIVNVDWNALNGDAETQEPTVEFEMQRIKETTQNKNSIVILMHDASNKEATIQALPQIITYLKEQGYEFQNFYDIIK